MNKREWMLQAALAALNGGLRLDPLDLTVTHLGVAYDAICAASPETPQEGAWVEHDGDVSKAPDEGHMVEVVYEDGYTQKVLSDAVPWDVVQGDNNVVRWRYA